ncbi:MAG: DNA primase [Clostridia bacterium]|nr:DNA primase [Clostridia bacterium]
MAGRFPEAWIDELRSRAEIVRVVQSYMPLKKNGKKFWGLCPFHGEKTASFSVDQEAQLFYCFGCKKGGSVIQFVMEMERLSFSDACKLLAEREHMQVPEIQEDPMWKERQTQRQRLMNANKEAARFYHQMLYSPEGAASLSYFRSRGLDDSTIRRFGLGASPGSWDALLRHLLSLGYTEQEMEMAGLIRYSEAVAPSEGNPGRPRRAYDAFRMRAMFPIIDQYGNVLGFGGRVLGEGNPKYLNTSDTPIYNKRLGVYAANLLRKERNLDRIILVEGYMDVIALCQFGVRGVVATLGTSLTPEQGQLLKRFAPKVYLSYDGDSAGQHAILRGLEILGKAGLDVRVLDFPGGMDPDEFIRREGPEAFGRLPVLTPATYRLRRLKENYDLSTQDGRTDYVKESARIIAPLDPVEIENHVKELVLQTGFSREALLAQIQQERSVLPARTPGYIQPPPAFIQPAVAQSPAQSESRTSVDPKTALELTRIQEVVVSTLASGRFDNLSLMPPEEFTDPLMRTLYEGLIQGRTPASLMDSLDSEQDRARAGSVLFSAPAADTNVHLRMVQECLNRWHMHRVQQEMEEVRASFPSLSPDERNAAMLHWKSLSEEYMRLKKVTRPIE